MLTFTLNTVPYCGGQGFRVGDIPHIYVTIITAVM